MTTFKTTTPAPRVAYVGQSFTIDIEPADGRPADAAYEYRVLAPVNGVWNYDAPWSSSNIITVTPSQPGLSAVDVQVRNASTKAIALDTLLGQYNVFQRDTALAVVGQVDRFGISTASSTVSRAASQPAWRSGINSFRQFADYVTSRFQASDPSQTGLSGYSATAAKALYYMQWVSGLFGDGNVNDLAQGGSVQDNEVTHHTDSAAFTVRTYLDSPIGNCTDYAAVLGFLLTNAGIANRIVTIGTHIFNEALLDGTWRTLDANYSIFYDQTWDKIANPGSSPKLVHFSNVGMQRDSANYRAGDAAGYDQLLSLVAGGYFSAFNRLDTTNWYAGVLPYGQVFLNELSPVGLSSTTGSVVYLAHTQSLVRAGTWTTALSDHWYVGDFNGDGKDDVLRQVGGAGTQVLTSTGLKFNAPATWTSANTYQWNVGDFNGDGKTDILRYVSGYSGAEVFLSTGSSFVNAGSWTPAGNGTQGWYVGDFNGDGKVDIFSYLPGASGANVFLSTGTHFTNVGSWTPVGNAGKWYVGDFNGDGKDDIGFYNPDSSQIQVLRSTGASFAAPTNWTTAGAATSIQSVGDFNGDGKDDIMDTSGRVYLSTGSAFVLSPGGGIAPQAWVVGDFDGNGKSDALYMPDSQGPTGSTADFKGLTSTDYVELTVQHLPRFTIAQVPSGVSDQASATSWRRGIDTFTEFYQYVADKFNMMADLKASGLSLPTLSLDVKPALYFMQWVSGMWAYGNQVHTDVPGSVLHNENAGTIAPNVATASTYVNARIGDASDEASLLALLLTKAGITNRVVTASGYVFNEVDVDEAGGRHTWTLDAAVGSAYDTSVANLIDTNSTPSVYEFDLAGTRAGSSTYRAGLGGLLHETTLSLADGLVSAPQTYSDAQWFAELPDALTFFSALNLSGVILGTELNNQALSGTAASDILVGAARHDVLLGGTGSDILIGGYGTAKLYADALDATFTHASPWTTQSTDPWSVGDFNGDGKTDILRYVAGQTGANVLLSDGSKFVDSGSWTPADFGTQGWYVGDFNGDGKDDVFRYVPGVSGAQVFLSNGAGFNSVGSWTGTGTDHWWIGDFNGDGKSDILRYVAGQSGANVLLSNGSKFVDSGSWTPADFGTQGWYVGDFNGDGKDDVLRYVPGVSGAQMFLSTGSGFVGVGSWTPVGADKWFVGDYNGDGKADIARYVPGSSDAQVLLSTGSSFVSSGYWLPSSGNTQPWMVGNFDGKGGDDLFRSTPTTAPDLYLGRPADVPDGNDTFVFQPNFGHDKVQDFQVKSDVLQFDKGIFADLASAIGHATQVGADTLIQYDANNDVLLHGVQTASLTAGNFKFV